MSFKRNLASGIRLAFFGSGPGKTITGILRLLGTTRWVLIISAVVAARTESDIRWALGFLGAAFVLEWVWIGIANWTSAPTVNELYR